MIIWAAACPKWDKITTATQWQSPLGAGYILPSVCAVTQSIPTNSSKPISLFDWGLRRFPSNHLLAQYAWVSPFWKCRRGKLKLMELFINHQPQQSSSQKVTIFSQIIVHEQTVNSIIYIHLCFDFARSIWQKTVCGFNIYWAVFLQRVHISFEILQPAPAALHWWMLVAVFKWNGSYLHWSISEACRRGEAELWHVGCSIQTLNF